MVVASPEMGAGVGHLVDNEVEVAPTKMGAGDVGSDSANQHDLACGLSHPIGSGKASGLKCRPGQARLVQVSARLGLGR
ncbi:hypothetical protein V6N12_048809 [Hibiscus sabdariffa]|uniref:Uncharacterized protein n=1 Tax=Hibiscus sabdariffa TaxID=183260 RepID=A0ABR2EIC9_9ROSI